MIPSSLREVPLGMIRIHTGIKDLSFNFTLPPIEFAPDFPAYVHHAQIEIFVAVA